MGIDDVRIEVNENDLQLKVRFAFEQPQLPGSWSRATREDQTDREAEPSSTTGKNRW